jgi:hypothetical protein
MGFASVSIEFRSKIVMFGGCQNDQGAALGDLIIFDASTEVWTEVQPASASDKPVARYDMGFAAMAETGKIYLVGGKLRKWTTGNSQVIFWKVITDELQKIAHASFVPSSFH